MAFIEFKDVVKRYGEGDTAVYANDHVDFAIEEGEFVVILGPSGAGKSTTLNILGGMDRPTSGEVIVDGKDIANDSDKELTTFRRNDVGFVFQFYNLIPNLSAKENVEMGAQIAGREADIGAIFDAIDLSDKINRFPAELSGGEQQRVSIARAIAKDPKLLLCDEPTGALDRAAGDHVMELLLKQAREYDRTVIVITHDQSFTRLADRVIHIQNGTVADIETVDNPEPLETESDTHA